MNLFIFLQSVYLFIFIFLCVCLFFVCFVFFEFVGNVLFFCADGLLELLMILPVHTYEAFS